MLDMIVQGDIEYSAIYCPEPSPSLPKSSCADQKPPLPSPQWCTRPQYMSSKSKSVMFSLAKLNAQDA
ncbi:unnamed protein product [Zymoseptoria tritici ST99CH_3D7]|uniref:Uncharacterized protein n=1 Tax=Zymoseptoria tritici (strain ST99CH_3D7) TaxID=1276538 RepID=A0A1X7RC52_ZYMT9|nr:unnamed protein product [Zymoseptoria tritici ST99CH_3D7]